MKKLSKLLLTAALCLFSQLATAQVPTFSSTNNNKTTERNNAIWYTIKNAVTGEYLRYEGYKFSMTTSPQTVDGVYALDSCNMFYVTGTATAAKIHNYAAGTTRICTAPNLWDETGTLFQIKTTGDGVFISQTGELAASDAFHYNEATRKVDLYLGSNPNSVWVFEKISNFTQIMGVDTKTSMAWDAYNNSSSWSGLLNIITSFINGLRLSWIRDTHSSLSAALTDLNTAQEIIDSYTNDFQSVFSYVEIKNDTYNTKYLSTNSTSLTVNNIQNTHTNVWKLEIVEGEIFTIFNEATNMYIGVPTVADGTTAVKMTADKNQAGSWRIAAQSSTETSLTALIVSLDLTDAYLVLPSDATKNVTTVLNATASTAGAVWNINMVDDVTIGFEFYSLAANTAWQHPYYLQENEGLVQEACELYTSNYPSDDESSSTCNLTDGVYTTCFTTDENVTNEEHYLQAELGSPVQEFYFYLKTNLQRTDARPTQITISGSTDGNSFTQIGNTVSTGLEDALYFFSEKITCDRAYKYLRFVVNEVNAGNKAFSLSEFYILPVTENVENCEDDIKTFYSTALYDNALRVPASDLIALEAEFYLKETEGKVSPELGEYRDKEYAALNTALENYGKQASDDAKYTYGLALADALNDYKNSICSPVFIISSAWEDGFSKNRAIYCDPTDGTFASAEANYWDLRQWYTVQGHTSTTMTAMKSVQVRSAINAVRLMNAQHSSEEFIDGWSALYESAQDAYAIRLYNALDYLSVDEYQELGIVHEKPTTSSNQNAAWYFTYVGKSSQIYDIDATNDDHITFIEALAEFGLIYQTARFYSDNYDETKSKMGYYHYDNKGENDLTKAGFDDLFANNATINATVIFNMGPARMTEQYLAGTLGYNATQLSTLVTDLKAHFVNFRLNTPPAGYYYRIRGSYSLNYLRSGITDGKLAMGTLTDGNGVIDDAVAATSVFYAVKGDTDGATNMLSFNTGRYIKHDGGFTEDSYPIDDVTYNSQNIYVHQSATGTEGYFAMAFNDTHYLCDNVSSATAINTDYNGNKRCDWTIEAVTELPVEVSAAQMTSLCAPVELEIPEGVTAYILTGKEEADGSNHKYAIDYTTCTEGTLVFNIDPITCNIIPAGMPVLIKAEAGVHYFPINYTPAEKDDETAGVLEELAARNMLEGTHDARLISTRENCTHHILAKKNGYVGMYKVKMVSAAERGLDYVTTETFINKGHRAWLPYNSAQPVSGYSFAIGGTGNDITTEIDEVFDKVKGKNEKAETIFDLHGRKLNEITRPGLYIVDGKKIFIK